MDDRAKTKEQLIRELTALRRSEEQFRRMLSEMSDGYVVTCEEQIVFANRTAAEMLNCSVDDLLGRSWKEFLEPELADYIDRTPMVELPSPLNVRVRRPDGRELDLELAVRPATYDGQLAEFALIRDVTERQRAEEALRQERNFVSAVLDTAGALIVVLDKAGRILRFNRACEQITGYTFEEVQGRHIWDLLLLPQEIASVRAVFEHLRNGQLSNQFENYWMAKDQSRRLIAWSNTTLLDAQGAVEYVIGIGIDVTERRQVEEQLRRRNRELALLNQVIATATSTLDVAHVLQIACEELALAFDLPQATAALLNEEGTEAKVVAEHRVPGRLSELDAHISIQGIPALEYIVAHQTPLAVSEAQTDARLASARERMRERGIRSLLLVPVIVARGRVAGTIGLNATERREFTQEEITLAQSVASAAGQALETARLYRALRRHAERLQETVAQRTIALESALERARDADRVKSEFVSNVSHELRSPLTNLKLYLDLLSRGRAEKRASYLETLRREADRLATLIENLLDLSRLDLGKVQANRQPTDLNRLVSTLVTDRETLIADRDLNLAVALAENLPPALADSKLIDQVLTNLLTNAVNYTPAGGTITLGTATNKADGRRWVTMSVADTGPGIPHEEQARLFERFYRGTAARASNAPGTGLGLAICQEIMDLHRGRITVQSDGVPGQGSTFTVWLEVAKFTNS